MRYAGSTIVIGDEACFCEFEATSEMAVAEASRKAGLSFDRIVPAVSGWTYFEKAKDPWFLLVLRQWHV